MSFGADAEIVKVMQRLRGLQTVPFTVECIQMVIGYLDIFVFEEFVLALRPVVDGSDCVLLADPGIIVSDEIYRGQYFNFMY